MIPTQEAPSSADIRLESFPEFATAGTKTPPSQAKYPLGYVPSDTFPAENANYLFNKSSRGVTQLNMGLLSVEKELNYLISQSGCTSCISDNTQVYNAIMYKINAQAACQAPTNHASAETTYGVGNADCFGHLKISDTYDCVIDCCEGVAASQYALATAFSCLSACGGAPINDTVAPLPVCSEFHCIGTSPYAARADHQHGMCPYQSFKRIALCKRCVAGQGGCCYIYWLCNICACFHIISVGYNYGQCLCFTSINPENTNVWKNCSCFVVKEGNNLDYSSPFVFGVKYSCIN